MCEQRSLKGLGKRSAEPGKAWLRLTCAAVGLCLAVTSGQVLAGGPKATSLSIPIYHLNQLAATIQIQSVLSEQPRLGPFRIAARPKLVLEGIEVTLLSGGSGVLEKVILELERKGVQNPRFAQVIQLRRGALRWVQPPQGTLEKLSFDQGRFLPNKTLELTGVSWSKDGEARSALRASVDLSGTNSLSGQLSSQPFTLTLNPLRE